MARPPYSTSRTLKQMHDLEEAEKSWNTGNPGDQLRSQKLYASLGQKTYRQGQRRKQPGSGETVSGTKAGWHPGVPGFPTGDQVGKRRSKGVGVPRTIRGLDPGKMGLSSGLRDRPALTPEDLVDSDNNPILGANPRKDLKGTGYTINKRGEIVNRAGHLANDRALVKALRRKGMKGQISREKEEAGEFAGDHGITGPLSRGRHRVLREFGGESKEIRAENLRLEEARVKEMEDLGLSTSPHTVEAQERLGTAHKDVFEDIQEKLAKDSEGRKAKQVGNIVTDFGTPMLAKMLALKPEESATSEPLPDSTSGVPESVPKVKDASIDYDTPIDFTTEEWKSLNVPQDKWGGNTAYEEYQAAMGIDAEAIRPKSEGGQTEGNIRKWEEFKLGLSIAMRLEDDQSLRHEYETEGSDRNISPEERASNRHKHVSRGLIRIAAQRTHDDMADGQLVKDEAAKNKRENETKWGRGKWWGRTRKPESANEEYVDRWGNPTGETLQSKIRNDLMRKHQASVERLGEGIYEKMSGKGISGRSVDILEYTGRKGIPTFNYLTPSRDTAREWLGPHLATLGINWDNIKIPVPTWKGIVDKFEEITGSRPDWLKQQKEDKFRNLILDNLGSDGSLDEEAIQDQLKAWEKGERTGKKVDDFEARQALRNDPGTGVAGEPGIPTRQAPGSGVITNEFQDGVGIPGAITDVSKPKPDVKEPAVREPAVDPAPKGWMENRTITDVDSGQWSQNAFSRIKLAEDADRAAAAGRRPRSKEEAEVDNLNAKTAEILQNMNNKDRNFNFKVQTQIDDLQRWHKEYQLDKQRYSTGIVNDILISTDSTIKALGDPAYLSDEQKEFVKQLIVLQTILRSDLSQRSGANYVSQVPEGAAAAAQ